MQVVFALAKAGHHQHVPEISERLRHERGYVPGTCAHSLVIHTFGFVFVFFRETSFVFCF